MLWGLAFPQGNPPAPAPVHPTQIYEILLMLPVFPAAVVPPEAEPA